MQYSSTNKEQGSVLLLCIFCMLAILISLFVSMQSEVRWGQRFLSSKVSFHRKTQVALKLLARGNADTVSLQESQNVNREIVSKKLVLEDSSVSFLRNSSKDSLHPLPSFSTLYLDALRNECYFTSEISTPKLRSCINSGLMFLDRDVHLKSKIGSNSNYIVSSGDINISNLEVGSKVLEIIAVGSIEIEKLDCGNSIDGYSSGQIRIYSSIGELRLPKTAKECLLNCNIAARSFTDVFVAKKLASFANCPAVRNWRYWRATKTVGDSFLASADYPL